MHLLSMQTVERLASLKFTLFGLSFFALAVASYLVVFDHAKLLVALALLVLAINLLCALLYKPVFRNNLPLLVFHIALLLFIVLVALGRLTYLNGRVELAEGEAFAGQLLDIDSGPWHHLDFAGFWFVNESFEVSYGPNVRRQHTYNTLQWGRGEDRYTDMVVGDQHPLILNGYRFYTTHNKGFSAVFDWVSTDDQGQVVRGIVNFPSYPALELQQANQWQLPGQSEPIWAKLVLDEVIKDPEKAFKFRTPDQHHLVLRHQDQRAVIKPGERIALAGGELHYVELRKWMGYKVFYDWTRPWLLATLLICVCSLGWYYGRKFCARPWVVEMAGAEQGNGIETRLNKAAEV